MRSEEIAMQAVNDAFVERYWEYLRWAIDRGWIERGHLEWKDVAAMMTVLDNLGLSKKKKYSVPDDIIGAFAEAGYGGAQEELNKK